MCERYRIAMTQSFGRSLSALANKNQDLIWRRLPELQANPHPDGSQHKLRLEQFDDVYRWRVGKYRVFYRLGPDCLVTLLGIEHRKDAYRQDALPLEHGLTVLIEPDEEDDLSAPAQPEADEPVGEAPPGQPSRPLPRLLTEQELKRIGVPPQFHQRLLACTTEDELLQIAEQLPDERLTNRVLDLACGRDLEDLLDDPAYVIDETASVQDILAGRARVELALDSSQREVLRTIAEQDGPFIITGAAGTGKTLVAVRALEEIARRLQAEGVTDFRFLFVTYTRTLAEFVQTLKRSALSPAVRLATKVCTLDRLVHELCPDIPLDTIVRTHQAQKLFVEQARKNAFERLLSPDAQRDRRLAASIKGITGDYLFQEITEVIIGRGLTSLDAYLEADRSGRRRPLNRTQREAIWALYEALTDILRAEGLFLHEELRQLALDQVQNDPEIQRYHAVVVDEVQDLTPVAVRLLHALCQDPRYLVLAGDEHQTIHLRTFSWRSIEQAISPCDGTVKRLALQMNHRCPPEIAAAVRAYRHALPDGGGRTAPPSDRKRAGRARPTVLALARWERWRQVLPDELLRLRQAHRLPWDHCAVLAPRNGDMQEVELALRSQHIPTEIVEHGKPLSPAATVKVLTWHNAKGLEFPAVFVLFPDWEPPPASFTDPPAEEAEESIHAWRQAAAVALGRASRHLTVLRPVSGISALLAGLDGDPWEIRVVEAGDESESDTAWDDLPF